MNQVFSTLAPAGATSWLGRGPWPTLFAGLGSAVVASLVTFLAAMWVLRRTLDVDREDAERRHTVALVAIEQQSFAMAEGQRRERTIAAAAQLTSGWVTPGWEWIALGQQMEHGLPDRRRWELVRRWLADGSRLYMNLVEDEIELYHAVQRTSGVLNGLLGPHATGPEAYLASARAFSLAINEWIRGELTIEETCQEILLEVERVESGEQVGDPSVNSSA